MEPYLRGTLTVAPCACGGEVVVAHPNVDAEVLEAIRYHQAAHREHREWRRRRHQLGEVAEVLGAAAIREGGRPIRTGLLVDAIEASAPVVRLASRRHRRPRL